MSTSPRATVVSPRWIRQILDWLRGRLIQQCGKTVRKRFAHRSQVGMGHRHVAQRFVEAVDDRVEECCGESRSGSLQDFAQVAEIAVELVDKLLDFRWRGRAICVAAASEPSARPDGSRGRTDGYPAARWRCLPRSNWTTRWMRDHRHRGYGPTSQDARARASRPQLACLPPPNSAVLAPIARASGAP